MQDVQAKVQAEILPTFIQEAIQTVEWGDWIGPKGETSMVVVTVNGRRYIMVETESSEISKGDPTVWINEFLAAMGFTDSDKAQLGFLPDSALPSSRPLMLPDYESKYICRLEMDEDTLFDYMLFPEKAASKPPAAQPAQVIQPDTTHQIQ